MRELRLGMLGCGVVGGGVLKLIERHRESFRANGFGLRVAHVAVRDLARQRDDSLGGCRVTADAMQVANDPEIDLLIEVMGGSTLAVDASCAALARGIPVVTANKAALARHLHRYVESAGGTPVGFEAAVAAHIPVIEVLDRSLACEEISLVKGVINGSTNYILTFMERAGCEYPEALADAAAKGFTEADPSLDVEGIDAAEKLSLLAFKAFGVAAAPGSFPVEGITGIRQIDIQLAAALKHRIKLVASARLGADGVALRVNPALVHTGELLADVDSEFNAVILEGPGFKELTFLGKGAGELPTASAVLNDVVKIARGSTGALPGFRKPAAAIAKDAGARRQCCFVRLWTEGVDEVLRALKDAGVPVLSHAVVDGYVGVITDAVEEQRLAAMLPRIAKASRATEPPALLCLDKDNYRDIVEREQRAYFGTSLERQPGAGV